MIRHAVCRRKTNEIIVTISSIKIIAQLIRGNTHPIKLGVHPMFGPNLIP
jgi:hypothetical protein